MPRPSLTASTMVAKLSSVSVMSAAPFATSVPVMPIAQPMSAAFSGGRVVDAVARHRDDLTLLLPCLDDADLVFGRNARVDGDVFDFLIELFVAHGVEFCARDGSVAFEQDAELPCDGGGGDDVVARDHDGLDARLAADGDGLPLPRGEGGRSCRRARGR